MKREEAVGKALDESLKRKQEEELYKPLDDFLKRLKKKIKAIFAPLFVSSFDQLHIVQLNKMTAEMYTELDEFNRKNYLLLVEHARAWAEWILGKKLSDEDLKEFVNKYLKGYDHVTQYVYTKEVDRKRMRLNEAVYTAREFHDIAKLQKAVKKSADLWFTQSSQYALDMMMAEIYEIYVDEGITFVRFHTQEDEKVCGECAPLDGKLFDVDACPKLPIHYNCRCFTTPGNPEESDETIVRKRV